DTAARNFSRREVKTQGPEGAPIVGDLAEAIVAKIEGRVTVNGWPDDYRIELTRDVADVLRAYPAPAAKPEGLTAEALQALIDTAIVKLESLQGFDLYSNGDVEQAKSVFVEFALQ